ncbi:type II toxin-antitoxin system PemK/MazF family toxin [Anaeromicrobium sediminis]|uniref:Growth inhibitor PemK n=1 Tax=Anaeromicrobium sediminis TaxID=1478221 RepID=A0A267MPH7_9FIRM|nr:type II toxin-antitoxin system PemK/MazF family toxin [Anaeromicrobium sediminis]PAB61332.1 hypothetical protein CCE28_02560 [Anaeromicrobium sediminis]
MDIKTFVNRGSICTVDMSHRNCLQEITKVIIVSNNMGNKHGPIVSGIPIVSKDEAKNYSIYDEKVHVEMDMYDGSRKKFVALCRLITTIDKRKLGKQIGHCNRKVIYEIDEALRRNLHGESYKDSRNADERMINFAVESIKDIDIKIKSKMLKQVDIDNLIEQKREHIDTIKTFCKDDRHFKEVIRENNIIECHY